MKRIFAISLVLFAALFAFACTPGETVTTQPVNSAVEVPVKPDGLVGDTAGVLSPSDIQSLQRHAEQAGRESNMQIGVSVVASTNGRSIEEFALNTARAWGVGKFSENTQYGNRSVLIQLAVNDRKMRLEVSRHFEGVLTDGQAGQVLDLAKQDFRAKNWAAGLHKIIDGVNAKGKQQLTMINPTSGTMLGFAAPMFLGFGIGGGILLLLLLLGLAYVVYRVFIKEEDEPDYGDDGVRGLPPATYPRIGSRQVDSGGDFYADTYRANPVRVEDDEAFDALAIAALGAAAATEPPRYPSTDVETDSYVAPEPVQESFGGRPDFAGAGASRSFETDESPSSGLLQSVTSYETHNDSPSYVDNSSDSNDSDSGSDASDSDGGSSDF